jgi:hypothetical protein
MTVETSPNDIDRAGGVFPYARQRGVCELCGRYVGEHRLRLTILKRGSRGPGGVRLGRGVYVCDRHECSA